MSTDAIEAAELCRISRVVNVAVSPDGSRVAFTALEWDQENNERHTALYVVPTDGSKPPHRLSRVSDASPPRWSPDGTRLGFIADREEDVELRIGMADEDEDEDEDTESQVWAFDLERGGDAIQLTDREWGVREFDWGPSGDRIVISARDPTDDEEEYLEDLEDDGPIEIERLQHKVEGVGFTDDVTTYLFIVDLERGEETRLDETAGAGAFESIHGLEPAWHPESELIAYANTAAERPDDTVRRDVHVVDVDSGEVDRLTDLEASLTAPRWSPSGDRLVTHGNDASNWYLPSNVFVIEMFEGTVKNLTSELEATVSWFGSPRFVDDDTVLAGFGDAGTSRLYRLDIPTGSTEAFDLGVEDDQATLRHLDIDGGTLAVVRSAPAEGIDLYTCQVPVGDDTILTRLTALNESFLEERPQPGFIRTSTSNDDVEVESMVYYPESFDPANPTPHPAIIWTHGGPMSYDAPEFAFAFSYFTSRGYLVVKPNYRGSTSYGTEFAETLEGRWGTVEIDDVLAVSDDLIDRDWIDERRQFATGFSYGGILTGYLITQSNRFAAAAAEHGIYDLRSEFGTSDAQVWTSNEFGLPWEHQDRYDASSSVLDVGGVDTPTLVTAGAQDWRCPPTQSEQFYVSLRKQDVTAKLIIYPEENHDVSSPERAIHRLQEIETWFEQHDPGRATDETA